jgi:hypothetical protein
MPYTNSLFIQSVTKHRLLASITCVALPEFEVPRVTRAAFYRWFDAPLERCMAALAERALAYAQAQQVDLPGPLSGVKDWYIVDSTTVRVRDALIDEFRGAGAYAALKVHNPRRSIYRSL